MANVIEWKGSTRSLRGLANILSEFSNGTVRNKFLDAVGALALEQVHKQFEESKDPYGNDWQGFRPREPRGLTVKNGKAYRRVPNRQILSLNRRPWNDVKVYYKTAKDDPYHILGKQNRVNGKFAKGRQPGLRIKQYRDGSHGIVPDRKILVKTGAMRDSIRVARQGMGFSLVSNSTYLGYHQTGTKRMVQRMIFPSGQAAINGRTGSAAPEFEKTADVLMASYVEEVLKFLSPDDNSFEGLVDEGQHNIMLERISMNMKR